MQCTGVNRVTGNDGLHHGLMTVTAFRRPAIWQSRLRFNDAGRLRIAPKIAVVDRVRLVEPSQAPTRRTSKYAASIWRFNSKAPNVGLPVVALDVDQRTNAGGHRFARGTAARSSGRARELGPHHPRVTPAKGDGQAAVTSFLDGPLFKSIGRHLRWNATS